MFTDRVPFGTRPPTITTKILYFSSVRLSTLFLQRTSKHLTPVVHSSIGHGTSRGIESGTVLGFDPDTPHFDLILVPG